MSESAHLAQDEEHGAGSKMTVDWKPSVEVIIAALEALELCGEKLFAQSLLEEDEDSIASGLNDAGTMLEIKLAETPASRPHEAAMKVEFVMRQAAWDEVSMTPRYISILKSAAEDMHRIDVEGWRSAKARLRARGIR